MSDLPGSTGGGWKPIESVPLGENVILYYPPKVTGSYRQTMLPEMYRVDFAGSTPHRHPTHWMPLPEPPK